MAKQQRPPRPLELQALAEHIRKRKSAGKDRIKNVRFYWERAGWFLIIYPVDSFSGNTFIYIKWEGVVTVLNWQYRVIDVPIENPELFPARIEKRLGRCYGAKF